MTNYSKLIAGTITALLFSSQTNGQDLKIAKGNVDTVYTSSHVIVGVTNPKNIATVNGDKVHVYKTGTFGKEVFLQKGDNIINVVSFDKNGNKEEINLSVFYNNIPKTATATDEPKISPASFIVKTKKGAYLNYGNGTDRLGGAKINYLAEGIKLQVIGETKNLYKVQLSENRYSFIPKEVVEAYQPQANENFEMAPTLSGSWSVINSGKSDRISISLGDKRAYTVKQEVKPNRIIIDLFGVQCNSNWITQRPPYGVIENVDIKGIDSDITQLIINLNENAKWGYSVDYNKNNLVIDIKHIPAQLAPNVKNRIKGLKIGVDAGHGGNYGNGAIGAAGHKEKDQNLSMAYILKELLEKEGATVVMSRESDDNVVNNTERLNKFKAENIDLLISIHCNAGGNPLKTGGTSTYYKHIEHKELAEAILPRLLEIEGVQNFGLVGNFNFTLNSATEFPSVLVETLFMSNLWDEEQIIEPAFQTLMMKKTVQGLKDYLNGF